MQNLWQNIWNRYMEQKNKRPVILVVDADEGYVNALEIKFVQKYIDKADLEFITDRRYLQKYLKTNPIVAVLVVSEAMYSEEVQQLMPIYTFVLMDERGNEKLGDRVYGIFRYSSGQNILGVIDDKVPETLFQEEVRNVSDSYSDSGEEFSDLDSDTELIFVTSASGGLGKTTVALGLAMIAADSGKKIMYFNLDYISNYDRWLMTGEDEFGNQILAMNKLISNQSNEKDKLDVLYEAIRSREYDTVIVDTGANNGSLLNHFFERANLILLITGNTNSDIYASNKLYHQLSSKWIKKIMFVCGNDMRGLGVERKEFPEYEVEKYISHIKEYETQTVDCLRRNRDFLQLYQIVNNKLNTSMKAGIELL